MKQKPRCVILGGGGHAKVLLEAIRESGSANPVAILDPDARRWKTDLLGIPIVGDDALLDSLIAQGVGCFVVGVGSVGYNHRRRKLFEMAVQHGLPPHTVVHPSACCSTSAHIERGVQLLAGSIVNAGSQIGENTIINTGAIVEHDNRLGAHVHISTGARLCGAVSVEDGAFVGAGATIIQGISIGAGALVGAGAVVIKNVEAGAKVVGVPGRTKGRIPEPIPGV